MSAAQVTGKVSWMRARVAHGAGGGVGVDSGNMKRFRANRKLLLATGRVRVLEKQHRSVACGAPVSLNQRR
jgi:hypothetical protein